MKNLLNTLDRILDERFKGEESEYNSFKLYEKNNEKSPVSYLQKKRKGLCYHFPVEEKDLILILNKKVKNITSLCDFFVFFPHKEILFVFLCELKTNSTKGSSNQVQTSEILARYIISMAEKELDFKKFNIEYRALIFSTSSKTEFDTNISKPSPYFQYENGLKHKHLKLGENYKIELLCY